MAPIKTKEAETEETDFGRDKYLQPESIWEEVERILLSTFRRKDKRKKAGKAGGGGAKREGKRREKRKDRNLKWDMTLLYITDFTFRILHNNNISYQK